MKNTTELEEVRVGRYFIRVGDRVRVKPSRPRKHDGGPAKVYRILEKDGRLIFHVIIRGKHSFYDLDRISRMEQTRGGEKVVTR